MGYLVAAVGFAVAFGLLQRTAQRQNVHYFHATGVNYVVATFAASIWIVAQGTWAAPPLVYWVGALNGISFAVLIVLQYFMLGQRGVGVTFALGSIALIAPITLSIIVFNEDAGALTLAGIGLLVIAAPLIAYRRTPMLTAPKARLYWVLVAGLLGFTAGTLISWKVITEITPADSRGVFVMMTFLGATAASSVILGIRRVRDGPSPQQQPLQICTAPWVGPACSMPKPVMIGLAMGLCNIGNLSLFLVALTEVPGAVAFPVHSAGTVLLTTLAGWVFWREGHGRAALIGITAAVIGLILVNL